MVDGIFQGSKNICVRSLFGSYTGFSRLYFVLFHESTDLLRAFSLIFTAANMELVHIPDANLIKRLCRHLLMLQRKYQFDILYTQ